MNRTLESLSDEELARRARAGSSSCFEEIVRRYQVPLVRFLARRFPSRRDVEDILQDTFIKAWRQLDKYNPAYVFRTWIYTIAYRMAVSRGRADRVAHESLSPHSPAPIAKPAQAMERDEDRHNLWQIARSVLSEEQYMAIWLFYVDELPASDVAKIMRRSWVSVKTMLHRARKKLAPYLAEPDEKPEETKRASSPPRMLPAVAGVGSLAKAGEL